MFRRNLYKKQYGFFPFCAPAGFRHQDQPVDIVDIYHKYNNPDKKYIFTLRDETNYGATSYSAKCGMGDRLSLIDYTQSGGIFTGYPGLGTSLLNGTYGVTVAGENISGAVAGCYMQFDFKRNKLIQEAKLYQDISFTHGTWRWQGSLDGVLFSNIGNPFIFGATIQEGVRMVGYMTELNSNQIPYRYYRLLGVSGSAASQPYLLEMEFKISDNVLEKFALTQGDSVRYGYELNGVKYEEDHNVVTTTVTNAIPAGMVSEILVNSTEGFPESGSVWSSFRADYGTYFEFNYTSKTANSFIGVAQNLPNGLPQWRELFNILSLKGERNWFIVNGNVVNTLGWNEATLYDIVGSTGNGSNAPTFDWLYAGKDIMETRCGNPGYGVGSVKYIHLESQLQLTHLEYCDFYGVPLTGELNIPESITSMGRIGPINDPYNYWVGLGGCYFTKVAIGKNVNLIVEDNFNYRGGIQKWNSYPLVAPAISSMRPFVRLGNPIPELHISRFATGYDVYPWNDKTQFSQIIRDL